MTRSRIKEVDFSATSDASGKTSELFDDYEEGTWTPTCADAASSGNTTTTGQGRYTKIGNRVYVNFYTCTFVSYTSITYVFNKDFMR